MYLGVVRISGRRRIRQPGPKHGTNGRPAIGGPGPESRDSVCRAPRHALPLLLQTVFSRKRTHHHPVCLPCCSMLAYSRLATTWFQVQIPDLSYKTKIPEPGTKCCGPAHASSGQIINPAARIAFIQSTPQSHPSSPPHRLWLAADCAHGPGVM